MRQLRSKVRASATLFCPPDVPARRRVSTPPATAWRDHWRALSKPERDIGPGGEVLEDVVMLEKDRDRTVLGG